MCKDDFNRQGLEIKNSHLFQDKKWLVYLLNLRNMANPKRIRTDNGPGIYQQIIKAGVHANKWD